METSFRLSLYFQSQSSSLDAKLVTLYRPLYSFFFFWHQHCKHQRHSRQSAYETVFLLLVVGEDSFEGNWPLPSIDLTADTVRLKTVSSSSPPPKSALSLLRVPYATSNFLKVVFQLWPFVYTVSHIHFGLQSQSAASTLFFHWSSSLIVPLEKSRTIKEAIVLVFCDRYQQYTFCLVYIFFVYSNFTFDFSSSHRNRNLSKQATLVDLSSLIIVKLSTKIQTTVIFFIKILKLAYQQESSKSTTINHQFILFASVPFFPSLIRFCMFIFNTHTAWPLSDVLFLTAHFRNFEFALRHLQTFVQSILLLLALSSFFDLCSIFNNFWVIISDLFSPS